jgi:Rho GTPase-activating protein RGD1
MADHSILFCTTLNAMSEELYELASNNERARKHWKQTGLNAEKRVQDAETAMEKAKGRYNSLAEQYDRARTGEKQSGKFGLKKSGAQAEEDLRNKLEASDADYRAKVEAAQSQRNDLMSTYRPQTVNALQELIKDTDAGLSAQMQKFASLSERLLLGHGLSVTPLKGHSPNPGQSSKSLREVASSVNNEKDFVDYVLSFSNKAPSRASEIKYEKHPSLSPKQQEPAYSNPSYGDTPYAPPIGRQVSGVTPYPPEDHYDQSRYSGQSTGGFPQQQSSQMRSAGPPQLPQIDSSSDGAFNDGPPVSPIGTDAGHYQPMGSGHARNVSSIGSLGALGHQPMGSPPPQSGMPAGPAMAYDHVTDRTQGPQGMGRGQSQDFGSAPGGYGRGQPAPGAPVQTPYSPPTYPTPGSTQGQPADGAMGRGQPFPSEKDERQQGPMGYGQAPQGAMGRGMPPAGMGPQMGRGQGPQGPGGMGQPQGQGQQQYPTPQSAPGMAGQVSNGARAGGVNALPSRQAAPRAGPPVRPVFGVSLDELFQREGSAVPIIVNQCVQAVERFGLNVEGLYRTSGSANHIMELRQQFDYGESFEIEPVSSLTPADATAVDFSAPSGFYEDIASVTTLLKHFLRDLPDPLLTANQYSDFIKASKFEDNIVRRDQIHEQVNNLPDPNYATLRVLAIHLHRVAQHSERNKMTHNNLAIVFAPTLMGQRLGVNGNGLGTADIADSGWQVKVVETILDNTFQIFDADE